MSKYTSGVSNTIARTRYAVGATLRRHDAQLVFGATTVGYLVFYLFAVGHLTRGDGRFGILIVPNAFTRFFQPSFNAFSFEPVARIQLGVVEYLFSLNTIIGIVLALLVGLNIAITYLAWRQPKACGIGSSSAGIVAGIPALLSGAACCGPILLIIIGIQATGILVTAFELLLPGAALLLLASLLLIGRQVDPDLLESEVSSTT